jgi:hypothetical protein
MAKIDITIRLTGEVDEHDYVRNHVTYALARHIADAFSHGYEESIVPFSVLEDAVAKKCSVPLPTAGSSPPQNTVYGKLQLRWWPTEQGEPKWPAANNA